MDYSLIIAIFEKGDYGNFRVFNDEMYSYSIGIIDFLQKYDINKRIERISKNFTQIGTSPKKSQISAADPDHYFDRFIKKIEYIINAE